MCKKMCAHFARGICVGRLTLNSNLSKKMPNIAVRLQGLILFHIPNLFRYFFEPRKQNYNLKTKTKTKNVIHFFFFCFCVRLLISSWWSIWFFFLKKKKIYWKCFRIKKAKPKNKIQRSRVRSVAPAGSFEFFCFRYFSYTLHQIKATPSRQLYNNNNNKKEREENNRENRRLIV